MIQLKESPRLKLNGTARKPTTHEQLNALVKGLRVRSTGVEDGCLYFKRQAGAETDIDVLASQIVEVLETAKGSLRNALKRSVTSIVIH